MDATVDVEVTPTNEQHVNGDAEQADEEGANGQQPESRLNKFSWTHVPWKTKTERPLTQRRHLPGHHQAAA